MKKTIKINMGTVKRSLIEQETNNIADFFLNYDCPEISQETIEDSQKLKEFKQNMMEIAIIGQIKNGSHRAENVLNRQALIFDFDKIDQKLNRQQVELIFAKIFNNVCISYPSITSYFKGLKLRLIVPLDFNVNNKDEYATIINAYSRMFKKEGLIVDPSCSKWSQVQGLPVITPYQSKQEIHQPVHIIHPEGNYFTGLLWENTLKVIKQLNNKPVNVAEQSNADIFLSNINNKNKMDMFKEFTVRNYHKLQDYDFFVGCMLRIRKCERYYHTLNHDEAVKAMKLLAGDNPEWAKNNIKMYEQCKNDVLQIDEYGYKGLAYFVGNEMVNIPWITKSQNGKKTINEIMLVNEIKEKGDIIIDDNKQGAIYEDHKWRLDNTHAYEDIKEVVMDKLDNANVMTNSHTKAVNITNKIYDRRTTHNTIEELFTPFNEDHASLIQFNNGVLDVKNWQWLEINRDLYIPNVHPVNINFTDDFEKIENNATFAVQWLASLINTENETENIKMAEWLWTYVGGMFFRMNGVSHFNTRLSYIVLLNGYGHNGKTTFTNYIQRMLGEKNCGALSLTTFTKNKFMLSQLKYKNANISDEMTMMGKIQSVMIKNWTGGGSVATEEKFNKNSIEFHPFSKLMFATNRIPTLLDDSQGMLERMIRIDFNNKVNQKLAKTFDLHLLYEMLPDVTLYALYRFHLWLSDQKNTFALSKTMKKWSKEWLRCGDTSGEFIDNYLVKIDELKNQNTGEGIKNIYVAYKLASKIDGGKPLGFNNFKEKVKRELGNDYITKNKRYNKIQCQRLIGYALSPDFFNEYRDTEIFSIGGIGRNKLIWTDFDNQDNIITTEPQVNY